MKDPSVPGPPASTRPPQPMQDYVLEHERKKPLERIFAAAGDARVRIAAALAVVFILSWLLVPPAYRTAKAWRAIALLDQSTSAKEAGDTAKSVALMRKAIYLAPGDERVIRSVQLVNAELGDAASLAALRERMERKEATSPELLVLAENAIRTGDPTLAGTALRLLPEDASARRAAVEARLLDLKGERLKAIALVREASALRPGDEGIPLRFLLAELLLKTDSKNQEAWAMLFALAQSQGPEGLRALRFLAARCLEGSAHGAFSPQEISALLTGHPKHEVTDALLAFDLELLAAPNQGPALMEKVARTYGAAPRDQAVAAARWLNQHKAFDQTLSMIGKDRAVSDYDFFLIYLDALAGRGDWAEVGTLLEKEKVQGLPDGIRLLFLARSSEQLNDNAGADEAWRELQRILRFEKAEDVAYVAAYSERSGNLKQALKAYWVLSEKKEAALQGFLGVVRCQPRDVALPELLSIYQALLGQFPNLAEAQCDFAYLQLLSNIQPDSAAAVAEELYRNNPTSLATLSVAALADLKLGNPRQADARYSGKEIAWQNAPEPWKAVRVAVLRAVGNPAAAADLSAMIRKDRLRPEELALVSETP